MTTYTLPGDGVHVVDTRFNHDSRSLSMEGTGSVVVEARYPDTTAWHPVPNSPLEPGKIIRFTGVADKFRFTVTGSGGPVQVLAFESDETGQATGYGAPEIRAAPSPAMAAGIEAFIVQPYSEANVKRGLEFYFRAGYPTADPISANGTRKIYFATGANSVLVKLRIFEYVAEELQIQIFEGPTGVTGGTPITISNWNRINPQPTTVTATKDVTTTTDGSSFEEPEYFFGAETSPARDVSSIPQGRERVLPPNTEYLVVIKNNDNAAPARCSYFLDWYEGDPDIS